MSLEPREAPRAWPDRAVLIAYVKFQLTFYVFFFPAYFGGAYIAERSGSETGLFLPWEPQIPYLPWMFALYAVFFWIFLLPMLHLRPRHFDVLTRQSIFTLVVAGLAFSIFPVISGFPPVDVTTLAEPAARVVEVIDTRYNNVPSLHVAFTVLLLSACFQFSPKRLGLVYLCAGVVIVSSTVFTHQHNLIDVATGATLALAARRLFPIKP